jgi:SAM-dependent methyltransferase
MMTDAKTIMDNAVTGLRSVLHVGCGSPNPETLHPAFRGPSWREVRLDIDAGAKPDIVASIVNMPEVPGGGYDALYSSHNIEHLFPHEVPAALSEFARVLKPDGYALITCPDLQSIAAMVAAGQLEDTAYTSPAGPIAPLDMLYGLRPALANGKHFMAHRTGFTDKTLGNALVAGGFAQAIVERFEGRFALWALGFKQPQSKDTLQRLRDSFFPATAPASPAPA